MLLTVSDTGTGIPPEIVERIFDPFFTTKQPGKGTGLGLASVAGIVKAHGGFVTVYTEPAKGTTFRVYLPAENDREVRPRPRGNQQLEGDGELILIVDDEACIRDAVSAMLTQHGYQVITAANGEEALLELSRHPNEIDLVLTDLVMPGMGGIALSHALHKLAPHLPVIACSGLPHEAELASLGPDRIAAFLPKPFDARALLGEVHRLLHSDTSR